jgi:hypothetical protein
MADENKFSELMTETVSGRERVSAKDSIIEQYATAGEDSSFGAGISIEGPTYTAPKQRGKRGNKGNKTAQGTGLATGGAQRDRHACLGTNCEQKGTNLVSIPHDKGTHFAPMCYDCKETAIKNAKKRGLPVPTSTPMTSQVADMFDVQDRDSEDSVPRQVVQSMPMRERGKKTPSKFKSSSGTGRPGVSIVNAVVQAMDPDKTAAMMGVIGHRIAQIPGEDAVTRNQINAETVAHPRSVTESPAYNNRSLFEVKGRRGELDIGLAVKDAKKRGVPVFKAYDTQVTGK